MSLIKKPLERRDYMGGFFTNPLPAGYIPTAGMAGLFDGGGVLPIGTESAMRHYTVFACVRIISDVISALPIDVFTGDAPLDPVPSKIQSPSVYASRLNWVWQVMASLLLKGNAYGMISGVDRLGYPTSVDIIAPDNVRIQKNKNTGMKEFMIGQQTLTTDQVWHLPGPQLPGELEGLSPIKYAARTINVGLEAEQFGYDWFRNGIHPTATLESDQLINSDQARDIKKRVKDGQAARDMVVLGAGLHLNKWQIGVDESQFLETLRHNAIEVAQIFGVPPEMLGAANRGANITYANREQRAQDFLNTAINPWLARLEDSLSAWFPRGTYVRFNTKELLRSDLLTRYQAHQIAIRNNFELPSEARAVEDMPPLPGIDDKPLPGAGASGGTSDGPSTSTGDGPSSGN
jgi:HK97 family phage portal protein